MNKTILHIIILLMLWPIPLFSQVLRNNGGINVSSGTTINIAGSYQNEGSGAMAMNGSSTIKLTGNWTNNGSANAINSPNSTSEVIFAGSGATQAIGGSYTTFDFPKLTVNSGAIVNVTAGDGVTAHGSSSFGGTFVLKTSTGLRPKSATFIDNGTVTGNITCEYYYYGTGSATQAAGRTMYFGPPISNATSTVFNAAGAGVILASYNILTSAYDRITTNGVSLAPVVGYELRQASGATFSFNGTPNTGSMGSPGIVPPTGKAGFYLIGNPYPSVLNWNNATKTNLTNNLIWYRTMNTSGKMVYDTYNANTGAGTSNNGTAQVDGKIPPMQCVWVRVAAGLTGSVSFDNSMRTHDWGNAQFIKDAPAYDAFKIAIYSKNGSHDEQIIMQINGAKDSIDMWDAYKMFVNDTSFAEIFTSSVDSKRLVMQAIAPVVTQKTMPLGLKVTKTGNFKFVADLSGSSPLYNYILEDKLLILTQDLGLNPEYNFTSGIVNDSSRFVIHINYDKTKNIDGINEEKSGNVEDVVIYSYASQIFIKNCISGSDIFVYDVLGRPVYFGKTTSDPEVINSRFKDGFYIVKVISKEYVKSKIIPIKN